VAFGIVDLNSAMTGINDYNSIRHNEDRGALVEQMNIKGKVDEGNERKLNNVHESDDAEMYQKKFDAKDKGSNEYHGDGGRGRRKNNNESDGKVIPKYSGFDMKI